MGDIRNKIAKIERAKAEKAAMETFLRAGGWTPGPRRREEPLPRCACGNTWKDAPAFWACHGGHFEPVRFYCPACLPDEMRASMLDDRT